MTPASSRSTRALAAVVALAGALAGVSGCATSRGTGAAAAPGAAEQDTWARLLQMADERRLDTAVVRTALRSTSTPLRAAAARAVGQVHGQAMAGDLRRLLADRDTAVAANAAFALGLLRDTAATATLAGTLPAASPDVGVEVAWALGQIGGPAREAIVSALTGRPARDPRVIGALLLAASRLRPTPVSAAVPYLASADPQVRWRAVYVAARAYAPDGVRAVLPLAADSSALVRALVARELSKRAAGDSLGTRALVALAALARDPDAHVRIEAVRALGGYGDAARDAVVSALRDADANVRIAAAQTLAPVLDGERAPWMQAWRADTGFMFRRSVLVSALHDDVVLPAADLDDADSWVHQGDWRYRAAVADAGAGAPSIERMREVSLPLARDPDPRVRAAGYAAMAPWADSAGEHVWRRQFMYIGLKDFDPYVRTICIQALTSRATAAEVPLVLASWQIAERDTVSDARVAAVRFFESAWRRDSAAIGDSIAAVLRSLPAPRDPLARAAAEDVPLFAAWRDAPAPAPRPLSWYRERVTALVLPAIAGQLPHAVIESVRGPIEIELFALDAPLTVDNFLSLARSGYYTDIAFHRVVPDFVAQDGDRRGDGNGGPAYTIRDELNRHRYERGAVGMALSGPDTGGSQYFLTLSPQPHLDGGYTVFGRVVAGFDAMDALVQGDSISAIRVR